MGAYWSAAMDIDRQRLEIQDGIVGAPDLGDTTLQYRLQSLEHLAGPPPQRPIYKNGVVICVLRWTSEILCLGQAKEMCEWKEARGANIDLVFVLTTRYCEPLQTLLENKYTIMLDDGNLFVRDMALHGAHKQLYGYPKTELFGCMPTLGICILSVENLWHYMYRTFFWVAWWPFFKYFCKLLPRGYMPWFFGFAINTQGCSRLMNVSGTVILDNQGQEIYRLQERAFGELPTIEDLDQAEEIINGGPQIKGVNC